MQRDNSSNNELPGARLTSAKESAGRPGLGQPSPGNAPQRLQPYHPAQRSYEPAYVRIANALSEQIAAGVFRPGDQLPTEPQLRAQYKVSPMTVRRAISLLLDRGLVTTVQGKGTFVRALDMGEAIFRLQEITDSWTEDDSAEILLLEARIRPADEEVATILEVEPGTPTVYLRRLVKREQTPLIYQLAYILYDEHRPLVEVELQITSLAGLLRSARAEGLPGGWLTIRAVSLDHEAAAQLGLPDGSPALCLESLFHDFDGKPLSWGRFLCRPDQFQLTSHLGPVPPREPRMVELGRTRE